MPDLWMHAMQNAAHKHKKIQAIGMAFHGQLRRLSPIVLQVGHKGNFPKYLPPKLYSTNMIGILVVCNEAMCWDTAI